MAEALTADLQPVDRVLTRWGNYERNNPTPIHPLEKIRLLHDGAVFSGPVPEQEWIVLVDGVVTKAPQLIGALLRVWYCRNDPVAVKANRLGISRAQIYIEWRSALRYVQGALGEKLHQIP